MVRLDEGPPAAPASSPQRRVGARVRRDFVLDATIFVGFAVAYSFGFTGPAVHEWWGLAFGAVLPVHLTLHWDWVVRTTVRLLRPTGRDQARGRGPDGGDARRAAVGHPQPHRHHRHRAAHRRCRDRRRRHQVYRAPPRPPARVMARATAH